MMGHEVEAVQVTSEEAWFPGETLPTQCMICGHIRSYDVTSMGGTEVYLIPIPDHLRCSHGWTKTRTVRLWK